LWLALASNYSGAWFWYTEENLNNASNTPANSALERPFVSFQGPWDGSTSVSNPNPYSVYRGITTFLKSWPGTGSNDQLGLDSYAWTPTTVTGPVVSGTKPATPGLATAGMIGTSSSGVTAFVWLVNNASNGGNPTAGGYPVVPANSVTVSTCSSCAHFKPGAEYRVQWWDTDTGTLLTGLTTETTASPSGAVSLHTPTITTDIAVTITSNQ
jgi:hypothetical protein